MPHQERLQADCQSLATFIDLNPHHLSLAYRAPDLRRFAVDARLDAPVVANDGWRIAGRHTLVIEIPDNYLQRDASGLFIKSRIRRQTERVFHPNVWPNDGYFCYDDSFVPSKPLCEQLRCTIELMQLRAVNHQLPCDWHADFVYLKSGDELRSRITPVDLLMPRPAPLVASRPLPRVA